jgi:hypothetical protein
MVFLAHLIQARQALRVTIDTERRQRHGVLFQQARAGGRSVATMAAVGVARPIALDRRSRRLHRDRA